VSGMQLVTQAA